MGIGMALSAETVFDERRGWILNRSLAKFTCLSISTCRTLTSSSPTFSTSTRRSARAELAKRHHRRGGSGGERNLPRSGEAHP